MSLRLSAFPKVLGKQSLLSLYAKNQPFGNPDAVGIKKYALIYMIHLYFNVFLDKGRMGKHTEDYFILIAFVLLLYGRCMKQARQHLCGDFSGGGCGQ